MVKFIAGIKRKSGMTPREFHRHWRDVHAPLVQSVPEFFGYVRKYVQSHAIERSSGTVAGFEVTAFDGIVELWFDSIEDAERAFTAPRYLEIIRPDEKKFIDLSSAKVVITEEVVIHQARGSDQ
jgi:uncharacterized protein (TIGR02118 family)